MFKSFFIKSIINWLGRLDGVPGFALGDVVEIIELADQFFKLSGAEKKQKAIGMLEEELGFKTGWIMETVAQLAYAYARIKGFIKR